MLYKQIFKDLKIMRLKAKSKYSNPVWSNYRPRAACGPPQRFTWPAETFRKSLQIWNLMKNVWGYICLTVLLALDKVHLHKNKECYLFCVPFCFIYFFLRSN